MDSFAPADAHGYYRGSFFLHPRTGKVVQVAQIGDMDGALIPFDSQGNRLDAISYKEVEFKHVRIPKLGYRSVDDKYLYYLTKIVGNNRTKGVNRNTISIDGGSDLPAVLKMLPGDVYREFIQKATLGGRESALVEQVFYPTFTPFNSAVEKLLAGDAYAVALNHDFAVALGRRADRALTLYFKGWKPVAFSEEGRRWKVVHNEYKDVIKRSIGELNYAT